MRYTPLAVGLALIVACAAVQGYMTQRWAAGTSEELNKVAEQYPNIPLAVGDWERMDNKDNKVSQGEMKSAGAHAYVSRNYRNTRTGQMIGVFMICGFARDIAVHTPDACYVGQGFEMDGDPAIQKVPAGDKVATMLTSTFRKQLIKQQIFWAWNNGAGWDAPENPRFRYPGRTPLNKIYLIYNLPADANVAAAQSPCLKFAEVFLPAVSKVLFSPAPPVDSHAAR